MFTKDEYIAVVEAIHYELLLRSNFPPLKPTLLGGAQSTAAKYISAQKILTTFDFNVLTYESLKGLKRERIGSILFHLEFFEKVLKRYPSIAHLPATSPLAVKDSAHQFHLEILITFENWYKRFETIRDRQLSDLTQLNFEKILGLVRDIDEKIQLNPVGKMVIFLSSKNNPPLLAKSISSYHENYHFREDALKYLKDEFVITSYEIKASEFAPAMIELYVNSEEFPKFKEKIKKTHEAKENSNKPNTAVAYTLNYDEMTGKIAINDKTVKKANLDSLVDKLFTYLCKNPNRKITLSELNKAHNKAFKDLPKVVESAGFTGNRLKAFFRVSKDAIYFRPQLTHADMKKLKITTLD